MSHKWYKHMANGANSDIVLALAEESMGHSGYAMTCKLRELMAAQTPYDSGLPGCEGTRKRLCKLLGCRDSKLSEFIDVLQKSGEFQIDQTGEQLRFRCPNFQLLLNAKAVSSAQRVPRAAPNRDKNDLSEGIKNDKKEQDSNEPLDDSSKLFWENARLIMAERGTIVLAQLPEILKKHFATHGPDIDTKNRLVNLIEKRFRGSEKAETLGEDICTRLNAVYSFAEARAKKLKLAEEQKKLQEKDQEIRRDSPDATDYRCKAVISDFAFGRGQLVEKSELAYTVSKLINYWGEETVRLRWKKMMDCYDNYKTISTASVEKIKRTHDDDDPIPNSFRKTTTKTLEDNS